MNPSDPTGVTSDETIRTEIKALLPALVHRSPGEAARMLQDYPEDFIAAMLGSLNPALAQSVLERFPYDQRQKIIAGALPRRASNGSATRVIRENSIGHMMEPALAVFHPDTTVAEATRELRHFVTRAFITYIFVVDDKERLRGVVAMREMLLAKLNQRLSEIMIADPFYLTPEMGLVEAMKATMVRHYPVYPVCIRTASYSA